MKKRIKQGITHALCVLVLSVAFVSVAMAKPLTVAVSIVPEARFANEILQGKGNVLCLIPEGASAETYAPSPKDLAQLAKADIYFTMGVPVENPNIFKNLPDSVHVVRVEELVRKEYADLMIGNHRDPHIWLSPKRAILMVEIMAKEIMALDPENADFYAKNAKAYQDKIAEADRKAREILQTSNTKKFIVFHPAFGYVADEYGLEMFALEHHGHEAHAKHLQELIDIAKKNSIRVIFHQREVSSRQVEAFATEIGGKAVELSPLSYDYTDNLIKIAQSLKDSQ